MIFARRALQWRLNELRETLADDAVDKLAARLNQSGKDRLAAMWEVAVLDALSRCGDLRSEVPLPSGRRPDVFFDNGALRFTADVTTVSDEGLDAQNPYFKLSELIESAKTKLGLPIGGLDVRVQSKHHQSTRGIRTVLRLPPHKKLNEFVQDQLIPQLREQMAAGEEVLRIAIDDDEVGLDVTINPARSPYSTGGFAAYDVPTIKARNPLYNALEGKVDQLRGADGVTGVIVGDGDCTVLADRQIYGRAVSATSIAEEFLRQYSSIDFVLLLTIRDAAQPLWWRAGTAEHKVHSTLVVRAECTAQIQLDILFATMLRELPKPVAMPANGALRAREEGYDLGHHGGYTLENRKIRISSRELIEVLAGFRTLEDNGAKHVKASRSMPPRPSQTQTAFQRKLLEGRLPVAVTVVKTDDDDNDDWIEFEFGDPDPAISPLK